MATSSDHNILPHEKKWLRVLDERVTERAGLTSYPDRLWLLKSRVEQRMADLGLAEMSAYVDALDLRPELGRSELENLVEALRVSETGWFRHIKQFHAIARWAASNPIPGSPDRTLRAWCAGCATGEEAYSLAMTLTDGLGQRIGYRAKVLGTDISENCVQKARAAVINPEGLAAIPPELASRFTTSNSGTTRFRKVIRTICKFRVHNLMEPTTPGSFHLILCRNVLLYFSPKARKFVLDNLAEALLPGGILVLGYSESIREISPRFVPHRVNDVLFWTLKQKTRQDDPPMERRARTTPNKSTAQTLRPPEKTTIPEPPPVLRLNGEFPDDDLARLARTLREVVASNPKGPVIMDLDGVDYFSDDAAVLFKRAAEHLAADGSQLILVATRPGVGRWLTRSGLRAAVKVASTVDDAYASVTRTRR